MENASYAKVRLESPVFSSKKGIGALSAVYIIGLVTFLVVGKTCGPKVFNKSPQEVEESQSRSLNASYIGTMKEMKRWHQMLFLHMKLQNPLAGHVEYEQTYNVSSWASMRLIDMPLDGTPIDVVCELEDGCVALTHNQTSDKVITCKSGARWCGWTKLLTEEFVKYPFYYIKVNMREPSLFKSVTSFTLGFQMVSINEAFTRYQMAWHYSWVAITLVFMFMPGVGFFFEMSRLHQNFWSRQQVRVGALLIALLFFNNVFFVGQIFSSIPHFFFNLYMVLLATFLAMVLFFWLELFSDLAGGNMQGTDASLEWERNRSKTVREYLPKLALVSLIWITTILVYIYVRVRQSGDPSYSTYDDLSTYTTGKFSGFLLLGIYFVWLGVMVGESFNHIGGMNPEYIFVMVITLGTILGAMAAVFTGGLAPDQHGSKVFTFFYGMFNLYILMLAFCYTPAGSEYADLTTADHMEMMAPGPSNKDRDADDTSFTVVESSRSLTVL